MENYQLTAAPKEPIRETLARSLHRAFHESGRGIAPTWTTLDRFEQSRWLAVADSALTAMSNWTPDAAMIERYKGPRGEAEYGMDQYHPDFVRDAWAALLKAATS